VKSMTGFGSATSPAPGGRVVVELKSVNARFLELKLALPRDQQALEPDLRALVQTKISRGRVDVTVRREGSESRHLRLAPDVELARATVQAWQKLQRELGIPGEIDLALLRDTRVELVRTIEEPRDAGEDVEATRKALERALEAHDRERKREGANLQRDMKKRAKALEKLRGVCEKHAGAMKTVARERLTTRLASLEGIGTIEPQRIVQEVALLVERGDVSEELTRLGSHLTALSGLLGETEPAGKRIEFLLQEILREFNTIGSKANHLPVTEAVLAAKGELEKLREQTANVE
jgi:uncharacterized protein (TIGR00255 family)